MRANAKQVLSLIYIYPTRLTRLKRQRRFELIARKFVLTFVNNVVLAIFGYIAMFFIARYMSAAEFGMIGYAMGFVGMLGFVADLGFGVAHVKRVSEGKNIEKCIGTYLFIKIVLAISMVVCVLSALFIWKHLLNRGFERPVQETLVYLFLIYYILINLSQVAQNTFAARMETAKIQMPVLIGTGSRFLLVVLVTTVSLGVVALACAYVVEVAVVALLCLLLFVSYPVKKPDRSYLKSYISFTLPMIIVSVVGTITIYADKVLIQLFWSSSEVGYYFASQRIADLITAVSVAITALLLPAISEYHAKEDIKRIRELTHLSERYLSMMVIPICIMIIILANPVIHVMLSDEYLPGVTVLRLFAIMILIATLARPYGSLVLGMNRPKISAQIGVFSGLMTICLDIVFIPSSIFGIPLFGLKAVGAVIAGLIATSVGFILIRLWAYKVAGIGVNPRILLHFIAACITGIGFCLLTTWSPVLRWYQLLGYGLLFIAVYLGILWLFREFTKKDLKFILDTLHPSAMWQYIRAELGHKKKR